MEQRKLERQFAEVRASNDDRKVKFIFSTDAKDLHGTRINPHGWALDNFNKNGIASYQHRAYGDPDPDMIIGKANAWVEDNRLVGTIDFETKDINPLADKIYRKVKNGTLNAVSVGFIENNGHWGNEKEGEERGVYYFDSVELKEISVVSIPSNAEALAMRGFEPQEMTDEEFEEAAKEIIKQRGHIKENSQTDLTNEVTKSNKQMEKDEKRDLTPETRKVEVEVKLDTSKFEEQVTRLVDAVTPKKEEQPLPGPIGKEYSEKEERDLASYRISTAILKAAESMTGRRPLDGIYREMHEEAVLRNKDSGLSIEGLGVPSIIHSRAPLKAITDASGGYTVATELAGFIDTLKNNLVLVKAGAKLMTGLQGDIAIPRMATNSTSTWVSEGGTATESNPTFEQVTMTPERLTTYSSFTRQLLKQSSIDVERIVRENLFYSVANALETAAFTADGTSQTPIGLANLSPNDAHHGSNGTLRNWSNIVGMEKMVAIDNALTSKMAYITNATVAGALKTTTKDTYQGGFIWEIFSPVAPKGMINGYDAYVTNVLTNSTTNPLWFGDWSQLMIGQWGDSLDLIVNPYSGDTTGTIRVVLSGYYDVNVTHPQHFAYIKNLR